MARTQLTIRRSSDTVNPTPEAATATDGNYWLNSGKEKVLIHNGGGGSTTVTLDRPIACSHGLTGDRQWVIAAGERRLVGPFPKAEFDQASPNDGQAWLDATVVTSLTYLVVGE